jgi:flagellar biosynthesis regulator FlaF
MKTSYEKFMASSAVQEISNVELASVKVDLALLDDVKARIDEARKRISDLKTAEKLVLDLIANASKFQSKLESEYGFANSLSTVIENALSRAEKSAKELGVDPNGIAEIKQLKTLAQQLDKAIIDADSTLAKYNG